MGVRLVRAGGSSGRRPVEQDGRVRSDDDQRFRDALVLGTLLAPEGAAAYGTAIRWWG